MSLKPWTVKPPIYHLKAPSIQKYVSLLIPVVEFLSFTAQNDICVGFETRKMFYSYLLKAKISLCSSKIQIWFKVWAKDLWEVFVTSQIVLQSPIGSSCNLHSTSLMWKCKGIRQLLLSFSFFPPSQVPDKKIDTILSTVRAVTRKRQKLAYC